MLSSRRDDALAGAGDPAGEAAARAHELPAARLYGVSVSQRRACLCPLVTVVVKARVGVGARIIVVLAVLQDNSKSIFDK